MDRPDLPLNALRVFEVATRQGSFTKAAIELRVTQAAVSHQIARLEDLLGVTLFLRTSQGLVTTDEGLLLFPVLEHGFDAMARALDGLGGRRNIEVLKVGVNTTFALGWLMPRLTAFRQAHPEIDIRISTNNNRVEILREGLDMAIRFGTGGWSGHEAIGLMDAPLSPLCAPDLAKRLLHPADLGQMTLLRSYRSAEWPGWFEVAGAACPPVSGPVLDSSIALAELAASGAGVALLPVSMFSQYIAQGRLVQPFGITVSAGRYYLAWPSDRPVTRAMGTFSKWISGQSPEETGPSSA
ncbi:LysR family transcriptional regulator [Pseudosulfitobacter pseudonitzschiae]|uniref:LysR family transcriptional regulator n=1 Tax=Pseudosulfitobacter pseudonitzschiae TaxID=1402135 RepID=UPI001AFC7121|nr:LysR family transcriptional regulator [Pseudosulfitobacter pseudonitzschiae]MBM1814287.1 LysR family transcriptional regulator [Pseudosulfitobacter pseudonitzschiae]MBM1831280.1 LysR family transcriptional regulator [Pseudosulfitobacter pseudonitzschiae]MBM1836147.1 LysR family transcriptional regulator [Pseudosulfitobacter pseudonitzschiae]MBM1840993.1 LysR family transcriptional regulator [Pseudosulfitobacter pseudonitzschiae]MBM1845018.1 LysR family transcriptional regulator [Pseudosulfi